MNERITKVPAGTRCKREINLDPAGKPVHCSLKAVMAIRDRPLCQKHAQETMQVIEAQQAAESE